MLRSIALFSGMVLFLASAVCFAQTVDKAGLPVVTGPVTVAQSVGIALRNSPTVASRLALAKAAKARIDNARSMTRLRVSGNLLVTQSDFPFVLGGVEDVPPQGFTTTPNKGRIDKLINAMYPIYTGGKLGNQVAAARALKDAEDAEAASTGLDVALAVKIAYHQVQYTRLVIEAAQERVTEATERQRLAEVSYSSGRIAKYDYLRSQTDLADAQQELNNAISDRDVALAEFRAAMGASQSSDPTLTDALCVRQITPATETLEAKALEGRPELAAARARIKSAEKAISAARGAYMPQVYATAMAEGWTAKDEKANAGYVVGIIAGLPILDGGQRRAEVEEARAMLEQAKAEERDKTLAVTKEVATALAKLDSAAKNDALAMTAVSQAEEDYRVMRMRYEAGKSTNVEVLDALASLTKSRTNKALACFTHCITVANLERATAGDL